MTKTPFFNYTYMTKITLPENSKDITLYQYQRYIDLLKRTDLDQFQTEQRKIQIFTGLKPDANITHTDRVEILEQIETAINTPAEFVNTFEMADIEFGFIPNFDKITGGEYMDLCKYTGDVESLHNLMAILFRPITKKDSFGNYSIAEYQGTSEWAEAMKLTPMNVVNGALFFFSEFVNRINELYPELKGKGTSEGASAERFFSKWGWYATIDKLAKGRLWKHETILKLNVHEILLNLCYKSDESDLKIELMKPKKDNQIEL